MDKETEISQLPTLILGSLDSRQTEGDILCVDADPQTKWDQQNIIESEFSKTPVILLCWIRELDLHVTAH